MKEEWLWRAPLCSVYLFAPAVNLSLQLAKQPMPPTFRHLFMQATRLLKPVTTGCTGKPVLMAAAPLLGTDSSYVSGDTLIGGFRYYKYFNGF